MIYFSDFEAGAPPLTLPNAANLQYWFKADDGAYTDTGLTTPAANNDAVAGWTNHGVYSQDAIQSTSARRPTFKTGGLNGKPYLLCDRTTQQYFEDLTGLALSSSSYGSRTVAFVVDDVDLSATNPMLGHTGNTGLSGHALYFRSTADEQIHFQNAQWRFGNLGTPTVAVITKRVGAGGFYYNVNGTGGQDTTAVGGYSDTITDVQFLRNTPLSGAYFHGRVYEFMVWDTLLDGADETAQRVNMATVLDYLTDKYDL